MKFRFFVTLVCLLFQTVSTAAFSTGQIIYNTRPSGQTIIENDAFSGSSSTNCNESSFLLIPAAIPCNGVSVTSVVFNQATRTIVSGTNNTVGVVYRYPNVGIAPDGTGIDALVTVMSYSNNQDADQTNFRDADTPAATAGFDNNLQPSLQQESGTFLSNTPWSGSITYRIQFVVTGTSTPRVITIAPTSIDNDGSTACGGLRESVTYSTGFNQLLINNPTPAPGTTQTIAGNVVTGPTTVQNGIGVGPEYASSALYVNVSQFDWTYSFATTGNCTAGGAAENRFGSLNLSCQITYNHNFAAVSLSGTVFNDADGLTDSTVNGTGNGAPGGTPLFANLIDSNGNVVSSVAVAANGTYTFPGVVPGNYTVQITTVQGVESSAQPSTTLPAGWVNTGENLGAAAGNDGTVNGRLPVTVGSTAITNANFGIEQPPVANNNTAPSQTNPGGTNNATVPPTTFSGTDAAPGTVTSIRITAFPSNATSITINGTQYTSATFPIGGVTVPANASGNPTQPILVDPINGNVTVGIPYVTIDNAGISSSAATASVPFVAPTAAGVSISGRVLKPDGRGEPSARVIITDADGNSVYAVTNPFGYFLFNNVESGRSYVVSVVSKRFAYQPAFLTVTNDLTSLDFHPVP